MTEIAFGARVLLAEAFALAGVAKLGREHATYRRIRFVLPLPDRLARVVARRLPHLELTLAIVLAVGVVSSFVGLIVMITMLAFTAFLIAGKARDSSFDCGCFGSDRGTVTWLSIARNVVLAGLGVVVFAGGDQPLSLQDAVGSESARTLDGSGGAAIFVLVTAMLATILLIVETTRTERAEAVHDLGLRIEGPA